jgi:rubredoxin
MIVHGACATIRRMPIYDYKPCPACGAKHENRIVRSAAERDKQTCDINPATKVTAVDDEPKCGAKLERAHEIETGHPTKHFWMP